MENTLTVTALVVVFSPIITYAILDISRELKKYQLVEAIGSADAWIGFAGSISYRWKTNILIEQDDEGNYKFEGSAFAFRYAIQFG